MDWSRAKTILIIAFIVLNLFLGLQLNQLVKQQSDYVETEEISLAQLKQIAKKNNIRFPDEPSKTPAKLAAFNATVTPVTLDGWKKNERGSYSKTFAAPLAYRSDRELAGLLSKEVPDFGDYKPMAEAKDKRVYVQTVKGRPIWDATLEVELVGSAIKALHLVHYELSQLPTEEELLTYPSALYQVIINYDTSGPASISQPKLGYRAKAYSGEKDILVPYWQFEVGDNLIYLNATKRGANEKMEITPKQQNENKGTKTL
ncbi:two-component system regulatory protein YycI [Laceyella putida]|uniref:Two-component system regulatory protein YycI n=1 Tax=Laceyella putida TaxID=110101 RepID=A0ABW2RGN3_9BACL